MEDKRTLVATGLVILLIIVLVGWVVFYLVSFIRGRQMQQEATQDLFPRASVTPTPIESGWSPPSSPSPVASTAPNPLTVGQNNKTYSGASFQLSFPKDWGLLTCSNSQNFELDPNNPNDQLAVACNLATKPVTFLVGQNSCRGGRLITLGSVRVRKVVNNNFVTANGRGIQYHWCTQTNPSLDITHRVGTGTAFSSQDYSSEVESIIQSLSFPRGS